MERGRWPATKGSEHQEFVSNDFGEAKFKEVCAVKSKRRIQGVTKG